LRLIAPAAVAWVCDPDRGVTPLQAEAVRGGRAARLAAWSRQTDHAHIRAGAPLLLVAL